MTFKNTCGGSEFYVLIACHKKEQPKLDSSNIEFFLLSLIENGTGPSGNYKKSVSGLRFRKRSFVKLHYMKWMNQVS